MPQLSSIARAALAGLTCLALAPWPAVADANDQPGRVEYAPTMLVLDASGSMAGADPAGGTKMDAAKRATRTLIDAAGAGAPLGLAVYGTNTGSTDAEKPAGCRDVTVLRAPQPVDKAALTGAVDSLRPRGYTPIGTALRVAADALPGSGPRSIVLVSDGADTCAPPDPCEVARQLAAAGVDLVVHAVGFGVDEAARGQLTCIAHTTGGTYTDAPDARSLDRVLPRVTGGALRNYQPAGIPVSGTPEQRGAPELRPGQYLDVLGLDERKYYTVDVPPGATAYFAATMAWERGRSDTAAVLQVEVFSPNAAACEIRDRQHSSNPGDAEVTTASVIWDTELGSDNDRCRGPGRYGFSVWRDPSGSHGPHPPLPLEILVGLEPRVTVDKGAPADEQRVSFRDPGADTRPVVGGGSFGTAAILDGSGTYTEPVRFGEFLFYRVYLNWGQGLAYRVRYGPTPDDTSANVKTALYTPFHKLIKEDDAGYFGEATTLPSSDDAIATQPIRYRNRENSSYRPASVAGWFYISVKLGRASGPRDRDHQPVPVHLDVLVTGQPEPGPTYDFASEEARQSGVFGQGEPRLAQAGPVTGTGRGEPVAQGQQATAFPTALVLGLAGAMLLLAGLTWILLARRRRPGR